MGGDSIDLTSIRLPYSQGATRMRPGILGSPLSSSSTIRGDEVLFRRKRNVVMPSQRKALATLTMTALLGLLIFWRRYQVHVEIQFYHRGWIQRNIDPVPALSGSCFNPATIAASSYNTTLAKSPKHVELHSGIALQLGDDCYDFASTLPRHPLATMVLPRRTIFHTYWRDDLRPLGHRQIALLDSILAMQHRESTEVIVWTNSDTPAHLETHPQLAVLLKRYGQARLSVRTVNKKQLARGTPMEGHALLDLADKKAWLDGDLVRLLVLWARGGVWVDFDTIMTGRDMRMLGEHEWVTQWDCYDKIFQPLNGAMMHFHQHSPYLCEMLFAMANDPPPRQGSTDWGSRLYYKVFRRLIANRIAPFKILPFCFTDGQACRLDNRLPDPFGPPAEEKKWSAGRLDHLRRKLDNVWAVHLHNQWEKQFSKDAWVDRLILSKVDTAVERYDLGEE